MSTRQPAQLPLGLRLPDTARLDNFIPGDNVTALRAVEQMVLERPAHALFVAGAAATGKTHLLQAACRAAQAQEQSAAYLPLADLRSLGPACLEGMEQFTLLALDDIDRCAGDADWEEALFHLFNRLREQGGRWLAAGRQTPDGAGFSLADLHSRLGWGGVFALQSVSDQVALDIVVQRARERGLVMPAEVIRYLQHRCARHVPALLQLLDRLDRASLQAQRRLTVPFVREVIGSDPE